MALQEVTNAFIRRMQSSRTPLQSTWKLHCLRTYATDSVQKELGELEETAHQATPSDAAGKRLSQYDPAKNAKQRKEQLPSSRYMHSSMRVGIHRSYTPSTDTSSDLLDTTAALSTLTNHFNPLIQHLENSCLVLSPSHVSSRLTNPLLRPT